MLLGWYFPKVRFDSTFWNISAMPTKVFANFATRSSASPTMVVTVLFTASIMPL